MWKMRNIIEPDEVLRRYLHLVRDADGHLHKEDNGDGNPDRLAKGDCCCKFYDVNDTWDCCYSASARPGIVRYTRTTCWYENAGCYGDALPPYPHDGVWIQFNNGNNIDTDDWTWMDEQGTRCACWVTKDKWPVKYVTWDSFGTTGCPPSSPDFTNIDGDAYVIVKQDGNPTDAWVIGYNATDRDCFGSTVFFPMSDSGGPYGGVEDAGDDFEGCCGDSVDYTTCVADSGKYYEFDIDHELTVVENYCCTCTDTAKNCVVSYPDYEATTCTGLETTCSSSSPDQNDYCPP